MKSVKKIVYLCSSRDFHAIDWYRFSQKYIKKDFCIVTDTISSEGAEKLVKESDTIIYLKIIDKFLFKRQSKFGDKWRNLLKFMLLPYQVLLLKKKIGNHDNILFHAHGMYYMLIAALANVDFIGTPQGSEILLRLEKSHIYRFFALKAMNSAKCVTIDSKSMQNKIKKYCFAKTRILQNGIDIDMISEYCNFDNKRTKIVSIRAIDPLYRIESILKSRKLMADPLAINFIYPFEDKNYYEGINFRLTKDDKMHGKLNTESMFKLFEKTLLAISIPSSDSSPKTVYEALCCGAPVAVTENKYIEMLPRILRERLIIVDLDNPRWFEDALLEAKRIVENKFEFNKKDFFFIDRKESIKVLKNKIYK
tara:strand:- start:212 stop:1306 length:1095 start_codon:yes stop_codon:yes gene_type:complete